jgi:nitroreductase
MPCESFLIAFSSITWREVWKYGERGFRYVNLDVGHAYQSLAVSAKMLGRKLSKMDAVSQNDLARLFGLNQQARFHEDEFPDLLVVVSKEMINNLSLDALIENVPLQFNSIANKLSPSMHTWEIIPQIEQATSSLCKPQTQVQFDEIKKDPTKESKDVVLQRRSVHMMDQETSKISKEQFHTILRSVSASLDGQENAAHLCLMLNRVDEYKKGLYILVRNEKDLENLRQQMHHDFLWEASSLRNLYFLKEGDFQVASKTISCSQDIASDGAFSLGMLCNFSQQLQEFGPRRYKELYWECGMVGQQLYLEATSLGLSGTGIGCFLDDTMHSLLGLKNNLFQILYHFTVGRGYVDSRIQTQPAYER